MREDPATAPHDEGALVIDDTGDRKDGTATAHVARQYLGSVGKVDNGIVAVTSLWADERCYRPVHAVPYTPASRLVGGERIPGSRPSRSWPWSWSRRLARPASGSERWWLTASMATIPASPTPWQRPTSRSCWPSSLAGAPGRRPSRRTRRWRRLGSWAGAAQPARAVAAHPAPLPRRSHRDLVGGDAQLGGWRPEPAAAAGGGHHRSRQAAGDEHLVSADQPAPTRQPPRPAGRPGRGGAAVRAAQLGRAGLQAGQGELGWADFQVRSDRAIRRHWTRVLRVLVLLAGRPRRAACSTRRAQCPGRSGGHAGGTGDRASRRNRPCPPLGRWRCVRCGPGSSLQRAGALLAVVAPSPPPAPLQRLLKRSPVAGRCTSTYRRSQQTTGSCAPGAGRERPSWREPRSPATPRVEGSGRTVLACPTPSRKHSTNQASS